MYQAVTPSRPLTGYRGLAEYHCPASRRRLAGRRAGWAGVRGDPLDRSILAGGCRGPRNVRFKPLSMVQAWVENRRPQAFHRRVGSAFLANPRMVRAPEPPAPSARCGGVEGRLRACACRPEAAAFLSATHVPGDTAIAREPTRETPLNGCYRRALLAGFAIATALSALPSRLARRQEGESTPRLRRLAEPAPPALTAASWGEAGMIWAAGGRGGGRGNDTVGPPEWHLGSTASVDRMLCKWLRRSAKWGATLGEIPRRVGGEA